MTNALVEAICTASVRVGAWVIKVSMAWSMYGYAVGTLSLKPAAACPLALVATPGNVDDSTVFETVLQSVRVPRMTVGRPRGGPEATIADEAYSRRHPGAAAHAGGGLALPARVAAPGVGAHLSTSERLLQRCSQACRLQSPRRRPWRDCTMSSTMAHKPA